MGLFVGYATSNFYVPSTGRSFLGERALQDWADGNSSAVGLAQTCRAGRRDGINIEMLDKLANVGTLQFTNCKRDLDGVLERAGALDHLTPTGGDVFDYCILPSETVKLISQYPDKFRMHLCPNENACIEFWTNFLSSKSGQEYAAHHPHLRGKTVRDLKNTIGLRIHEDSGPYSKSKSVDVISWSSMLGKGSEKECKYQQPAKTTAATLFFRAPVIFF